MTKNAGRRKFGFSRGRMFFNDTGFQGMNLKTPPAVSQKRNLQKKAAG